MLMDCKITDFQFTSSPAITAVIHSRPEDALGYQYSSHPRYSNPSASDIFFFAENWLWNSGKGSLSWHSANTAFSAIQREQIAALLELSAVWKHHVEDPNVSTDIDYISETVENVFEVMSRFGPQAIDLTEFSNRRINGEHLATVLRVTSSYRDQIPGWNNALDTAISALEAAHLDPRDALAGLI